jgi:hypothetical protein
MRPGLGGNAKTAAGAHDWVATEQGFAFLYEACEAMTGACDSETRAPYFAEVDHELRALSTTPLRQKFGKLVSEAWGLECNPGRCQFVGMVLGGTPELHSFELSTDPKLLASAPSVAVSTARVDAKLEAKSALASEGSLSPETTIVLPGPAAAVAATHYGSGTLVAVLGTEQSGSAPIYTIIVNAEGVMSEPIRVTSRAIAASGIAVSAGPGANDGAAIAWVANDDGDLQVHLTKVDSRGRRINETQVSNAKGKSDSVAIATTQDGYIAAWVDGRLGAPEVFAARFDVNLQRLTKEERITELRVKSQAEPGDGPRELNLSTQKGAVWASFTDAKSGSSSSVYTARISARLATRMGPLVLVDAAASGPVIIAQTTGVGMFFVDTANQRVAEIDLSPQGALLAGAAKAALKTQAQSLATSTLLATGDPGRCLFVHADTFQSTLQDAGAPGLAVDGVELQAAGSGEAPRAFTFGRIPSSVTMPVFVSNGLYTVEQRGGATQLVRRALKR